MHKSCKDGYLSLQEDLSRKGAGSNPGAGKNFSCEISINAYLLWKNGILFICGRCLMYFLFRVYMWQMNHVSESIFGFKKVCHHILVGFFIGTRRVSIELKENKIMPVRSRWPMPSLALAGVSC